MGFKKISEQTKDAILLDLEEANSAIAKIKVDYGIFEDLHTKINTFYNDSKSNNDQVKKFNDEIEAKYKSIQGQIVEIEKIFETKPVLDQKIIQLNDVFVRGDDYDSKLGTLYKSITDRKKEIDELYYQIIGYSEKDDEGVETKVKGLKDDLENSYAIIKSNIEELDKELATLRTDTQLSYKNFSEKKEADFKNILGEWEKEYSIIIKKISDLLPNALTAGLSYAYSEKKDAEVIESKNLSKSFYNAIYGLMAISLIPLLISLKSIADHTTLIEVILRIPRLVLAILPLYIPVLWVAYSSNRKMNLSKRLIEEYSHKEVLSKTFEGLSNQINSVTDKDISSDLRIKLLYNILEVNSENPGKLISDYNKSDHPLMDALDKSIKLTNAVTKLSKIPGFAKLASTLEKKSEVILKEEGQKANAGLESLVTKK